VNTYGQAVSTSSQPAKQPSQRLIFAYVQSACEAVQLACEHIQSACGTFSQPVSTSSQPVKHPVSL